MPLGMLFKRAKIEANRVTGRLDVLQAAVAAGAYAAAGDGNISDKEEAMLKRVLRKNETISAAFTGSQIDEMVAKMLDKADGGTRSGRQALLGELRDIRDKEQDYRVLALMVALDVADADSDGDAAKELKALENVASELGLKLSDYE